MLGVFPSRLNDLNVSMDYRNLYLWMILSFSFSFFFSFLSFFLFFSFYFFLPSSRSVYISILPTGVRCICRVHFLFSFLGFYGLMG